MIAHHTHDLRFAAVQDVSKTRTEPYKKYGEGVLELATTHSTKSIGRVVGSAGKQANAAKVCV